MLCFSITKFFLTARILEFEKKLDVILSRGSLIGLVAPAVDVILPLEVRKHFDEPEDIPFAVAFQMHFRGVELNPQQYSIWGKTLLERDVLKIILPHFGDMLCNIEKTWSYTVAERTVYVRFSSLQQFFELCILSLFHFVFRSYENGISRFLQVEVDGKICLKT